MEKYVRKQVATSMSLRMVPEIRFFEDTALLRAEHVLSLLDQIKQDREAREGTTSSDTDPDGDAEHEMP
jgi:ribosome-binding factor A